MTRWLGEARQNSGNDDLKLILVGAKADQGARRQVSAGEAADFARKHGMVRLALLLSFLTLIITENLTPRGGRRNISSLWVLLEPSNGVNNFVPI